MMAMKIAAKNTVCDESVTSLFAAFRFAYVSI